MSLLAKANVLGLSNLFEEGVNHLHQGTCGSWVEADGLVWLIRRFGERTDAVVDKAFCFVFVVLTAGHLVESCTNHDTSRFVRD